MIRRWVHRRMLATRRDWVGARHVWHACAGTPWQRDAELYLDRVQRRYHRWLRLHERLRGTR